MRGLPRATLVDGAECPEGLAVRNLPSAPSGARSGGDGRRLIPSSRTPRLHPGVAGADHVDVRAPALRAAPAQMDQQHVAAAGVDQGGQVRVALMTARPAGQQDAHVAGVECGPCRRQLVEIVTHRYKVDGPRRGANGGTGRAMVEDPGGLAGVSRRVGADL